MQNAIPTILSTAYFPPISWVREMLNAGEVVLENCESYAKQTYRNRCEIASTNGKQSLTIPIMHDEARLITDVKISNHSAWRHQHLNAIMSAYGESPFYEYYIDDILPVFEKNFTFLYDLNLASIQAVCNMIDAKIEWKTTDNFVKEYVNAKDFRNKINPKQQQNNEENTAKPYYQVFISKHGFMPNLSILDLIFNQGPESLLYI